MKRWLPFLVFSVGLIILIPGVLLSLDYGPFERTPVGSQAAYWQRAVQSAVDTTAADTGTGGRSPYVSVLKHLASSEIGAVQRARNIQSGALLALFALGAFLLARRRVGAGLAVIAGLAVPLLAPLVLNLGSFDPAPLAAVLLLAVLVLVDTGFRIPLWALGGILLGLAARVDPLLSFSVGSLLLAGVLFRERSSRHIGAGMALVGGWALAVVLTSFGPSTPLVPTVTGTDIYRGHRPGTSGVSPRRTDEDFQRWWTYADYAREASRVENRFLSLQETSLYWTGQGLSEVARHPLADLLRWPSKIVATFQGDPLPREVGAAFLVQKSESSTLSILVWIGRLLIPVGLWGLWWGRRRVGWILGVAVCSGLLASMITFASPYLRLLTVAATTVGVSLWIREMVSPEAKRVQGVVGTLVALAVFGLWPVYGNVAGLKIQGDDYYFLGTVYDSEQRGSAALREYERAIRVDPTNPYPNLAVAAMLARDNVNEEALRQLEALREQYPELLAVLYPLVGLYQAQQRWLEAAAVYGVLTRLEPWNPEHWNNLGTMYVQVGYYDQAARGFNAALRIQPDYAVAKDNLEMLSKWGLGLTAPGSGNKASPFDAVQESIMTELRQQNFPAAEEILNRAYADFGKDRVELQFLEGTLRLLNGEPKRAITVLENVRQDMPNSVLLLFNLAAGYRQTGQLLKAKEIYEEAQRLHPSNERVRRGLQEIEAALAAPSN